MYSKFFPAENEPITSQELQKLVQEAQKDNRTAVNKLMEVILPEIRQQAKKLKTSFLTPEDLVNGFIVHLLQNDCHCLKLYRPQEGKSFLAYIQSTLHHFIVDCHRKEKLRATEPYDEDPTRDDKNKHFFIEQIARQISTEILTNNENRQLAIQAIKIAETAMNPNQKRAVIAHYCEGLTCEQIAQLENVSRSTICTRLDRAREAMRRLLEQKGFTRPDFF